MGAESQSDVQKTYLGLSLGRDDWSWLSYYFDCDRGVTSQAENISPPEIVELGPVVAGWAGIDVVFEQEARADLRDLGRGTALRTAGSTHFEAVLVVSAQGLGANAPAKALEKDDERLASQLRLGRSQL